MNILYLIGNGFDINLGMKTEYKDFYTHYLNVESPNENIKNIKSSIKLQDELWSDLEIRLGELTHGLTQQKFEESLEDIRNNLAEYLKDVESKFDFSNVNKEKLKMDLCRPINFLTRGERENMEVFQNSNWSGIPWKVSVITFNYTQSLEKLFGTDISQGTRIGTHDGVYPINFKGIKHIHGYVDERMILGVSDTSQIKNLEFRSNQEILAALVKSEGNRVSRAKIDEDCIRLIQSANLICIFGSSIGETDKYLWDIIAGQLKVNCYLILFFKGDKVDARNPAESSRREKVYRDIFLNMTTLSDDERKELAKKIFVVINADIFSGILALNPKELV